MRTAAHGKLVDEGVGQFMFENSGEIGRDRSESLQRNAKFAVVQSASPGWRLGDIEESLIGVEDDANAGARLKSELAGQLRVMGLQRRKNLGAQGAVFGFQSRKDLSAKCLGALCAFIT